MPDFFDRLIARGAQAPGGEMSSPGRPERPGRASDASGVTLARPRLPGPFERLAADPSGAFVEAIDESWEADAPSAQTARARPALGLLAGTQAAITPPPLLQGGATWPAPGSATTRPGEHAPARPAPAQPPPLPRATPADLLAQASGGRVDQASARASGPADRDQERGTPVGRASRAEHPIGPPSAPRALAVPASAVRAARPAAAADTRAASTPPPAPPPVVVRIGRIEVRNPSPDRRERQAKRRAGRAAPKLTLAQYLAAASGARNGNWAGGGR